MQIPARHRHVKKLNTLAHISVAQLPRPLPTRFPLPGGKRIKIQQQQIKMHIEIIQQNSKNV